MVINKKATEAARKRQAAGVKRLREAFRVDASLPVLRSHRGDNKSTNASKAKRSGRQHRRAARLGRV